VNIFKDDLLKNKYFLIVAGAVLVILALLFVKDYNSVENRCKRRYEKASSYFGTQNRLQEVTLDTATNQLTEECINQSSN
jgi:hypothetical protein